jgi:hypothetical protein
LAAATASLLDHSSWAMQPSLLPRQSNNRTGRRHRVPRQN